MPPSDASYLRCRHCKGFYETSFARCKWCEYDAPYLDREGKARVFPDRETCRAIQLAEYEQLPPDAHDDHMGPPKEDLFLLCNCLHCGPEGHSFEAIEMRWIVNERMWACPCTTCGGRGFGIDIHSAENKWQCAQCGHFYVPQNRDYRWSNAKCPKCGCTEASGWFDDDDEEEDELEDDDDPFPSAASRDEMSGARDDSLLRDQELPWDDDDEEDDDEEEAEFDAGHGWRDAGGGPEEGEDDDDGFDPKTGRYRMPDDIDHPQPGRPPQDERDFNDDDIPF
jgi:hypothetical protein